MVQRGGSSPQVGREGQGDGPQPAVTGKVRAEVVGVAGDGIHG